MPGGYAAGGAGYNQTADYGDTQASKNWMQQHYNQWAADPTKIWVNGQSAIGFAETTLAKLSRVRPSCSAQTATNNLPRFRLRGCRPAGLGPSPTLLSRA